MGGAPNYNKQKRYNAEMSWKKHNVYKDVIKVGSGKGIYPKCLQEKPYAFCPIESPDDPKNVARDCKQCPQFVNSKFYSEIYMTHERCLEMLKKRGLPLVIGGK